MWTRKQQKAAFFWSIFSVVYPTQTLCRWHASVLNHLKAKYGKLSPIYQENYDSISQFSCTIWRLMAPCMFYLLIFIVESESLSSQILRVHKIPQRPPAEIQHKCITIFYEGDYTKTKTCIVMYNSNHEKLCKSLQKLLHWIPPFGLQSHHHLTLVFPCGCKNWLVLIITLQPQRQFLPL